MFIRDGDKRQQSADERLFPTRDVIQAGGKGSVLDDEAHVELHNRLMGFWRQEIDRQEENRREQAIDEDFYDNIQWSEEDKATLKERGQAPLVFNVIAQSINWIIGSEKRGRTDWKVYPRGKEDGKQAEAKTKLLKYLSDVNQTTFHRSRAFEDAVKVGVGWIETGLNGDDEEELVYDRYESWRNILWDSASTELDLKDARYLFRSKWTDLDVAKAIAPDRADVIEMAAQEGSSIGYDLENGDEVMDFAESERGNTGIGSIYCAHLRERVRLIECWFMRMVTVQKFMDGPFKGETYDDQDMDHVQAKREGWPLRARPVKRMYLAIMTSAGLLYLSESPYKHNRFPFTPIWCNRRGRDGMPYGFIRNMRDIQEDINKRMSKALAILSTNKTIMDEGAVPDLREFEDEISRPNSIIIKRPGKSLEINVDRELAPAHLELASRSISMIQSISGVTDELLGKETNAASGKAVLARQEQGQLTTSKVFDNLRLAVQLHGQKLLSLVEQFFSEEKTFRITNDRGAADFIAVNDGLPENDITATQADFIVGEADWRITMRRAQNEQLVEMMTRMPPEIAMVMLDLVVEGMDVENREEIVRRIRQATGQKDPDADPNAEPTPEEAMAMQAQQQQQEIQQQAIMLDMDAKAAETEWKRAQAQKAAADAQIGMANVQNAKELKLLDIEAKKQIEAAKVAVQREAEMARIEAERETELQKIREEAAKMERELQAKADLELDIAEREAETRMAEIEAETQQARISAQATIEAARMSKEAAIEAAIVAARAEERRAELEAESAKASAEATVKASTEAVRIGVQGEIDKSNAAKEAERAQVEKQFKMESAEAQVKKLTESIDGAISEAVSKALADPVPKMLGEAIAALPKPKEPPKAVTINMTKGGLNMAAVAADGEEQKREVVYERDSDGKITAIIGADGRRVEMLRDKSGKIVGGSDGDTTIRVKRGKNRQITGGEVVKGNEE